MKPKKIDDTGVFVYNGTDHRGEALKALEKMKRLEAERASKAKSIRVDSRTVISGDSYRIQELAKRATIQHGIETRKRNNGND